MEIRNASIVQISEAASKAMVGIARISLRPDRPIIYCHLRPLANDTYRRYAFTATGMRRSVSRIDGSPALCWHGYWHFYRALFRLVPTALTRSRLPNKQSVYYTVTNFLEMAPPTGCINMSSWAFPVHYHDGCKCDKMSWVTKEHTKEKRVWKVA